MTEEKQSKLEKYSSPLGQGLTIGGIVWCGEILNKALKDENHLYGILATTGIIAGYKLLKKLIITDYKNSQ